MNTPTEVQRDIKANNAAIDHVTEELRQTTRDLGAAQRVDFPDADEVDSLREQKTAISARSDALHRAKRQLALDLQAAQSRAKVAKQRVIEDCALPLIAEAEEALQAAATDICALSALLGRPRTSISIQGIGYQDRLAEMESEL